MSKVILKATRRDVVGKHVKAHRREGKLPAVVYGVGVETTPIWLDLRDASRTLASVGQSTLVTVELDGKEVSTLIRERQRDVLKRTLLHVDLMAISLTETVRANVRLSLDGIAPAVETYNAIITTVAEYLEIECLPTDLVDNITVDITNLVEIGDSVYIKDLVLPEGIDVLDDPETMIVVASAPTLEIEEEEEEEELVDEDAEPEVIEKGKAEEEEEE